MRSPLALILAVLSWLLAGCGADPAVSLRPLLISDEKPVTEPRLEGDWTAFTLGESGVSEDSRWKVAMRADGCYQVERQAEDKNKEEQKEQKEIYRTCLVSLDSKLFFDAELDQKKVGPQMIGAREMSPGMVPVHLVGRLWAQPDFFRMAQWDAKWAKQNVPKDSRDSRSGLVVFTGSTQQLRSIVAQHADDVGAMPVARYLCRPGADCRLQVVDDELSYAPESSKVLEGATWFFIERGDYDRALALSLKRVQLEPTEPWSRLQVGLVRLFQRDFSGVRREFAAAEKLGPDSQDQTEDLFIGATYFLEGNYTEAHKIFAKLESSPDTASAMLIVLDYASLARMGRSKQAEIYLSKQMSQFVGNEADQLLLLRSTGRVKDFSGHFTDDELEQGEAVLYALVREIKGDRESARRALEETMNKTARNSPVYLAAKIELERLGANASR